MGDVRHVKLIDVNTVTIKGDKGDTGAPGPTTIAVGTTTTLGHGVPATVTNVGTTDDLILDFGIPQGLQGIQGNSITSITLIDTTGLVDTYEILFSDTTTTTFTVTNGAQGNKGDTGASITSAAFVANDIVFTKDDANTVTLINAAVTLKGVQGDKGDKGDTGDTGNGIATIALTSGDHSPGTLDTYTVTYTDASTTTFQVYNGANGSLTTADIGTLVQGYSSNLDQIAALTTDQIQSLGTNGIAALTTTQIQALTGAVLSVNSIAPSGGNVALDAADVGAVPTNNRILPALGYVITWVDIWLNIVMIPEGTPATDVVYIDCDSVSSGTPVYITNNNGTYDLTVDANTNTGSGNGKINGSNTLTMPPNTWIEFITNNGVAEVVAASIPSLVNGYVVSLTTSDIGSTVQAYSSNLGQLAALTTAQISALESSNLQTVSALNTTQIQSLGTAGIAALTTSQISILPNHNDWHGVVITRPATRGPIPANVTTTTFTLSAAANPFDYYYQGIKKSVTTDRTVTIETFLGSGISTAGLYHIYFNSSDVLTCSSSFDPFALTGVYVANVYWNGTNYGIVSDERHMYTRNIPTHKWQHSYVGCRYGSGLDFAFAGTTNANTTFTISAGTIADEDIIFSIAQQTQARLWYQTAAGTYTFLTTLSALPYYAVSATPGAGIYAVRGDTYALVSITSSNRYFNYWVFATTSLTAPIHIFVETVTAGNVGGYSSVANARLIQPPNISSFGLSAEWKLLHRVVVNGAGLVQAYSSSNDDYRTSGSLPGGGTSVVNHDATSPQLAATGVTYGHIDEYLRVQIPVRTVTNANGTLAANDGVVRFSTGNSDRTLAMDAALVGQVITVKKVDSGTGKVTFTAATSCTIDGSTTLYLGTQYQTIKLQCVTAGAACVFDRVDRTTWD